MSDAKDSGSKWTIKCHFLSPLSPSGRGEMFPSSTYMYMALWHDVQNSTFLEPSKVANDPKSIKKTGRIKRPSKRRTLLMIGDSRRWNIIVPMTMIKTSIPIVIDSAH